MGPRGVTSLAALAVLLVGAGAAGTLVLRAEQVPDDLRRGEAPTSAPVTRQDFDDERNVQVGFTVSAPAALALRAAGTVTALSCEAGSPLASGGVVARVDDRPVVALHTDVPLYRDLSGGEKGADVAALQRELSRLGFALAVDGRYRSATRRAVRALQARAGTPDPDGAVHLADLVWLPSARVTPSSCDVQLGATVTAGSTLATVGGRLLAVTVKAWPAGLADGPRRLTVFDVGAPVGADHRVVDAAALERLAATPDVRTLQAAKSTEPVNATLALVRPLPAWKVAPSAVFAVDGARGCLASGARTYPVTIVGSGLGASLVAGAGDPPDRVDLAGAIRATGCR